jgi:hypothetical protein
MSVGPYPFHQEKALVFMCAAAQMAAGRHCFGCGPMATVSAASRKVEGRSQKEAGGIPLNPEIRQQRKPHYSTGISEAESSDCVIFARRFELSAAYLDVDALFARTPRRSARRSSPIIAAALGCWTVSCNGHWMRRSE